MLALEHLPDGQATVGFEVCIKHVAGAAEGAHVHRRRATLREVVDERKWRFDVEVREGDRTHRRRHARAPGGAAGMTRPSACASARSARATASRTSPRSSPTDEKVELIDGARADRAAAPRGHVLRARRRHPAARRRPPRCSSASTSPTTSRVTRADPEREAASTTRSSSASASTRSTVFLSASRDAQPQERQPLDRGVAGRPRARAAARAARRGCAARASSASRSAARTRAHVPRERVCDDRAAPASTRAPQEIGFGDTTGMANPLPGARVLRGGARRRSATTSS